MKDLMPKIDRDNVIEACRTWLQGNLTTQEIKDTIGTLSWAVEFLELEASMDFHANIEWVYELGLIDGISVSEQNRMILELAEENKEELEFLAKKVIDRLELDVQEFIKEADNNHYCRKLIKKETSDE